MTNGQKQQIIDMRAQGVKYLQIAEALGLSVNTIKSFCRRITASEEIRNEENKEQCKQCGNALTQREKGKPRSFCCDRCRHKWWNAHRSEMKRRVPHPAVCACCQKEFDGGKGRKYCCHACYIKDRYGKEARPCNTA